jgi:hypothetical protein
MMAETAPSNYSVTLSQALLDRKDWLERSELVKLKEELRVFQISYSVLYNMFLKKKLINEDPYKQETKISELEVPDTGPINEAKRLEQISLRLANYDSQLDFLVNFYQFGVDFLNLERLRRILGLVRYIDWGNMTPDSKAHNTRLFAEITNNAKSGGDALTLNIIGESLTKLPKGAAAILGIMRNLSTYYKESYKLNVRNAISGMQAAEATLANIKKKMSSAMPGTPFYQEFIDELIKEDYSKDGPELREAILKSLAIPDEKPKAEKPKVSYKNILLSGIRAVGTAGSVLAEIAPKLDENEATLASQKKGFWEKIRQIIRSMTNADPEDIMYELEYIDQVKGVRTEELLNFNNFRNEINKKIKILTGMSGQGPLLTKLEAMEEAKILEYLERIIRDLQNVHRTLSALDEYFKTSSSRAERDKIKGIKPELASIKNSFVKANQIRHEYSAAKEEEEQLKRMGINPNA